MLELHSLLPSFYLFEYLSSIDKIHRAGIVSYSHLVPIVSGI